jgi:exodeoxyribonuclease VII small subunit
VANKKTDSAVPDFEGALKKLESLVAKMESGELTLEQAMKHFEQGVSLARQCQEALREAEARVEQLITQESSKELKAPSNGQE